MALRRNMICSILYTEKDEVFGGYANISLIMCMTLRLAIRKTKLLPKPLGMMFLGSNERFKEDARKGVLFFNA